MNKDLYIVGAGGHVRSLLNLISNIDYSIKGILDDSYNPEFPELINKIPVIDSLNDLDKYEKLILGIGNITEREKLFTQYRDKFLLENLIHKSAIIEPFIELKEANQIFANAYINSNSVLGSNNIINTGAIIEHENIIGNHNHISIGAVLGGRVKIGNTCFIGAGATIIDKISVCDDVIVGANSVVVKDITQAGTYVGNPLKRIK